MDHAFEPDRPSAAYDIVVVGGGSACEALLRALGGRMGRIAVVERGLVGGECAYVACMPSKSMLHDAAAHLTWDEAVTRRTEIVEHLDDTSHAKDLHAAGATLVRGGARIVDAHTVLVGEVSLHADHLVLATGSEAVAPPIDGLDTLGELRWTSDDALTARLRPDRLLIVGGGVIGMELAQAFARFGTHVTLVDEADRAFPDLDPRVGEIVDDALAADGVRIVRASGVRRVERDGDVARAELTDGSTVEAERVLVAVGKRARTTGLGLQWLGLDPDVPIPVGNDLRVDCPGSVWALGDVAGKGQYTHLANHHGAVVAAQLLGDPTRRADDAVVPSCVFTDPPVMVVGPSAADLGDDPDVVWTAHSFDEIARPTTDDLGPGHLAVAARRSTGTIVAAHGVGARIDELTPALTVAIDGGVPVAVLARTIQPFPTVSELLGVAFKALAALLASRSA